MQKTAFAMLSKSAYGMFTAPGGRPMAGGAGTAAPPSPLPPMPAMSHIAPLGGSPGSMYGQTMKAPPSTAPAAASTGMPAAGTPVTPGMATDERMHAQNKLNASAGGTVAAQKAPSSAGPTADQLAVFRKGTASKFDPNSRLDRAKMEALIAGNKGWAANQGARGNMAADKAAGGAAMQYNSQGRSGSVIPPVPRARVVGEQHLLAKTAFAMLEKEAAGGLAGLTQKGFSRLGGYLKAKGLGANSPAMSEAYKSINIGRHGPDAAGRATLDAASKVGQGRMAAGDKMRGIADKIGDSKGIQGAINYGTGAVAGGAGLYGAHSMGENSGHRQGVEQGVDMGMDLGIQGAQAMQPGDPGFMGRLGDLFTGTDKGPDLAQTRLGLMSDRDKLIQSLIAR